MALPWTPSWDVPWEVLEVLKAAKIDPCGGLLWALSLADLPTCGDTRGSNFAVAFSVRRR